MIDDWTINNENELHEMLIALGDIGDEEAPREAPAYSYETLQRMVLELAEHLAWRAQLKPLKRPTAGSKCMYRKRFNRERELLGVYNYDTDIITLG